MVSHKVLEIRDLSAGYGSLSIIKSITFEIAAGEVATLIGRNGMGKSTIVKSLTGQIRPAAGWITFDGCALSNVPSYAIARLGMSLVPEGRMIFPNLSVEENLVIGESRRPARAKSWTIGDVYRMFPRLQQRRTNLGTDLSGGEQQMLAIGRALMTNPLLLILDEATEGLAPIVRNEIWGCLAELKRAGLSMLIIDKNLAPLARLADRHFVIEKGKIVWQGSSAELIEQQNTVREFMTV